MYDAFISYSRKDLPDVERLEQRLGTYRLNVFRDKNNLRAGHDWPPELGAAIKNSRALILCWSQNAAASTWVELEYKSALTESKSILPWLLDATPLPAVLQKFHAVQDPAPVAQELIRLRRRHALGIALTIAAALPLIWFAAHRLTPQTTAFQGSIVDEQNRPIPGVTIEADEAHASTDSAGRFAVSLPIPPDARRAVKLHVSKPGYQDRTVDTQSDVPQSLILERAN